MKTLSTNSEQRVAQVNFINSSFSVKRENWPPIDEITCKPAITSEFIDASLYTSAKHVEELLYRDISNTISAAKKSLPKNKDLDSVLTHMVSTLLNHYNKDRNFYHLLIRNTFSEPNNSNSQMDKPLDEQLAFIAYFIELLKSKGRVFRDFDSQDMARSVYDLYIDILRDFLSHQEMSVSDAARNFSTSLEILQTGVEVKARRKY